MISDEAFAELTERNTRVRVRVADISTFQMRDYWFTVDNLQRDLDEIPMTAKQRKLINAKVELFRELFA